MNFATNSPTTRIAFIDPSIPEYQKLVSSIQLGTEVIILDPNRDGISQITETLANYQNVTSINIISHGTRGEVDFSSSKLNLSDLSNYTKTKSLVVIAPDVENPEVLIAGVQPDTKVLLLQDSTDSISQISEVLAANPTHTLSIVCHGSSGKLELGKTVLDRHSLPKYQQQLQAWGVSELVLYACEVGQERNFITQLSEHIH